MTNRTLSSYRRFLRSLYWFKPQQRKPLRYYLRMRFRTGGSVDAGALENTASFVEAAARNHGLERRILLGLAEHLHSKMLVDKRQEKSPRLWKRIQENYRFNMGFYQHLLDKLNHSMNLCI